MQHHLHVGETSSLIQLIRSELTRRSLVKQVSHRFSPQSNPEPFWGGKALAVLANGHVPAPSCDAPAVCLLLHESTSEWIIGYCKCQMFATSSVHGECGNDNTSPNSINQYTSLQFPRNSMGKSLNLGPIARPLAAPGRWKPDPQFFLRNWSDTPKKSTIFFFVVAFVVGDLSKFP